MMDAIDKKMIDILQQGLEICEKPYQIIADSLKVTEEEVIERIERLKHEGIIRRVSAFFEPRLLGYKSTLCAVNVPIDNVKETVEIINSYDEITHNYMREDDTYNIWFTVIAYGEREIERIIIEISEKTGYTVENFPSKVFHKIKVRFYMGVENSD